MPSGPPRLFERIGVIWKFLPGLVSTSPFFNLKLDDMSNNKTKKYRIIPSYVMGTKYYSIEERCWFFWVPISALSIISSMEKAEEAVKELYNSER